MEYSADETIVPHDDVKCCVVMPDGHLKPVTACWCKLYHILGMSNKRELQLHLVSVLQSKISKPGIAIIKYEI